MLSRLLAGTGITFRRTSAETYTLVEMRGREAAGARKVPAAPKSAEVVGLEPIIVTARKRAEYLEDTPLAIAAFSASDFAATGRASWRICCLMRLASTSHSRAF